MLDKLKNEVMYLRKLYKKDHKILNCLNRKCEDYKVNLHWWSTQNENNMENIGDYLSLIVCEYMLKKKNLSLDTRVSEKKHLYAIGSIIQGGAQNATIWGSGIKNGAIDLGMLARKTRKLDIRAVRGPKTREALLECGYDCPDIYGDPAILMPLIYKPKKTKVKDYAVILHHATERNIEDSITPLSNDYKKFIDYIYNSKLVISSSLHGIILAEAYGIPAILLTDKVTNSIFKYDDYYYSTGRFNYPIAESIEEALKMLPASIPNFDSMRNNIMNSFPYDLWLLK